MKKITLSLLMLLGILVMASNVFGKTKVYRYADEPFDNYEEYFLGSFRPGPAAEFGQDVYVYYEGATSGTVRFIEDKGRITGVGWHIVRHGMATIYAYDSETYVPGEILYHGPFQMEEIGRDDGNDAACIRSDGLRASSACSSRNTNLDFLVKHVKITGNSVYFFKTVIKEPGLWCETDTRGEARGLGCE